MSYTVYNVKWEIPRPAPDPVFDGLAPSDKTNWDYLATAINRYLSLEENLQKKHELKLRRYLISRPAHDAFLNRPTDFKVETESFEFWVFLLEYLEWYEAQILLSMLTPEYAFRYILEVAPELSYEQQKPTIKRLSQIEGIDMPYDLILKLIASTKSSE